MSCVIRGALLFLFKTSNAVQPNAYTKPTALASQAGDNVPLQRQAATCQLPWHVEHASGDANHTRPPAMHPSTSCVAAPLTACFPTSGKMSS